MGKQEPIDTVEQACVNKDSWLLSGEQVLVGRQMKDIDNQQTDSVNRC